MFDHFGTVCIKGLSASYETADHEVNNLTELLRKYFLLLFEPIAKRELCEVLSSSGNLELFYLG